MTHGSALLPKPDHEGDTQMGYLGLGAAIISIVIVSNVDAKAHEQMLDRAADCAAISYIETAAFPEQNAQSEMITQRSRLSSRFLGAALGMAEPGRVITNGDVSKMKGARMRTLNMIWSKDPNEVLATQRLCWEWFAGLFEHLQTVRNQPGIDTEQQAIESALSKPIASIRKRFDAQRYDILEQLLTTAIENWRAQGSITPDQLSDVLERNSLTR